MIIKFFIVLWWVLTVYWVAKAFDAIVPITPMSLLAYMALIACVGALAVLFLVQSKPVE